MRRALGCAAAILLCVPGLHADELKLRDGTKITGTIVGFENNSFKVETSYGFALVRRDKVASITLTEVKADARKPPEPVVSAVAGVPVVPPTMSSTPPAAAATPPPRPAEPAIREEVDKTTYINHTFGFKMFKPPRWQVIEGAHRALATAVVAMGTSDETTLLVVGRETMRGSLESETARAERRLKEIYENYRPLGEARTVVSGLPATQRRFRGTVGENDWSGVLVSVNRGTELFTILGITYADSDLIQIQENVIARTIASLEFTKR